MMAISMVVFLIVIMLLVLILLYAKKNLVAHGNIRITINDKETIEAPTGGSLLSTLAAQQIFLPSACGG
ncbi:MAG: NADH:ubiquinone reductase (Na(+)-transporting) subunit F, partial [Bacteroidales bacterium]|nr:NADH:ubiquinone reductase (Na(+)-transporting) subunit F [Bacteroidales bacterium]